MYSGKKMIKPESWIWSSEKGEGGKNQYVYFEKEIEITDAYHDAVIHISVDTDYALWINGTFVNCGQYVSYPHIKFYDCIDIKPYLVNGSNTIRILAFYAGTDTASYIPGKPGLFSEILIDSIRYATDETWQCSAETGYINGDMYSITSQIGYGFQYDARLNKNMIWNAAVSCKQDDSLPVVLYERPVEKLELKQPVVKEEKRRGKFFVIDLKNEISGFATLTLESKAGTKLKITYEEALGSNHIIGPDPRDRKFYFFYTSGGGKETFTHYLRKIACRYLQIEADDEIYLETLGVIPVEYPVNVLEKPKLTEVHSRIYDICIRTLINCMHEKYEDTPWREQALYAQDARNQALFGYKVFDNKEFPLACIKLLKESIHEDGFVRLTAPSSADRFIPSFSYMWVLMLADYYKHGGSEEQARLLLPYADNLLQTHIEQYGQNGFLIMPDHEGIWNFYEWTDGLDGAFYDENDVWTILPYHDKRYDAILNLYFLIVLKEFIRLLENLAMDATTYKAYANQLSRNINSLFFNQEKKLYCSYLVDGEMQHYCELTQSLAILADICCDDIKESLIHVLTHDNDLVKITLSCMSFKLDAILTGKENLRDFVMNEIERIFSPMLSDDGSGCCWETEKGKSDFGGCGSMCHGWSAFPLYFY